MALDSTYAQLLKEKPPQGSEPGAVEINKPTVQELAMARIYHRSKKKQGLTEGSASASRRNTRPVSISQDECDLDLLNFMDRMTSGIPFPKLVESDIDIPRLARHLAWPDDMIATAFLNLIEYGAFEYRFDGTIEFLPRARRRIEREGV